MTSKNLKFLQGLPETDDCIVWPFGRCGNGQVYGSIWHDGRKHPAHRVSLMLHSGAPPTPKHQAAHRCGNTICVNPKHLRWATRSENELDKKAHGTMRLPQAPKLSREDVLAIVALRGMATQKAIARQFNVSDWTVNAIMTGKSRQDITGF